MEGGPSNVWAPLTVHSETFHALQYSTVHSISTRLRKRPARKNKTAHAQELLRESSEVPLSIRVDSEPSELEITITQQSNHVQLLLEDRWQQSWPLTKQKSAHSLPLLPVAIFLINRGTRHREMRSWSIFNASGYLGICYGRFVVQAQAVAELQSLAFQAARSADSRGRSRPSQKIGQSWNHFSRLQTEWTDRLCPRSTYLPIVRPWEFS